MDSGNGPTLEGAGLKPALQPHTEPPGDGCPACRSASLALPAAPLMRATERLFLQSADDGTDDVAVIVGPDPLVGVRLLPLPVFRLCNRAEVFVRTRGRHHGFQEHVFIVVLGDIARFVDAR